MRCAPLTLGVQQEAVHVKNDVRDLQWGGVQRFRLKAGGRRCSAAAADN